MSAPRGLTKIGRLLWSLGAYRIAVILLLVPTLLLGMIHGLAEAWREWRSELRSAYRD